MRFWLTFLPSIALLPACGSGKPAKKDGRPAIEIVESPFPPAEYQLEDPACQDQDQELELTQTTVRAWEDFAVVDKDVALVATRSTPNSLESSVISLTSWADVYVRECDLNKGELRRCDDKNGVEKGWALADTGGDLKICKNAHTYGRQTYEGVALTSSFYLTRAHDRYVQLAPGAAEPQKVQLSVLPEFVDVNDHYVQDGKRKKLKSYITHNLAYFPVGQMIAVFPETVEKAASLPGFFWESEFVLGHEYGHHVDFTRHGKVLANAGLEWSPLSHSFADTVALGHGLSADSDRARIQGALSEAFADLLAYYSAGGTGLSIVGLPDIGKSRDISNGAFLNGDDKVLTLDRLETLFGLREQGEVMAGEPKYSDVHVIGAIFSHTADQLFAELTKTKFEPGSAQDVDQRYKLTLVWMDALVEGSAQLTSDQAGASVLQPMAMAFERAFDSFLGSFPLTGDDPTKSELQKVVCNRAAELIPSFESPPFASADGRCE